MLKKLFSSSLIVKDKYFGNKILRFVMTSDLRNINYEQLKDYITNKSIYLIDVREKFELEETGVLPNSINIPLGEIESALKLTPEEFKNKYNFKKPDIYEELVFSCRSGKRSQTATEAALKLGFKNASNYSGGWLDWEKNMKK